MEISELRLSIMWRFPLSRSISFLLTRQDLFAPAPRYFCKILQSRLRSVRASLCQATHASSRTKWPAACLRLRWQLVDENRPSRRPIQ